MTLTFKEVSEIMKIIDASDCDEVLLELEGIKLVVRRGSGVSSTVTGPQPTAASPQVAAQPVSIQTQSVPPSPSAPAPAPEKVTTGTEVRAPMVGSFYQRPSPDQPPFVEIGTRVAAGDSLCLIEVMKLYTTITAPVAGTVKHIAVEDTQLVEFDQLLLVIEPE